ncbi:MAG: tetratricopeptide repeat protein [bacterium]
MTLLIIIILALAVVALYPLVREFIQRRRSTVPAYVGALRLILDGRDSDAIPLLKEAVNAEPANIDAWVRLGDAYIRAGELERGIKIHENLGLRRNLRPEDERRVLSALARDYEGTDRKLKAITVLEELARNHDHDAVERLLRLYQATGAFEKSQSLIQGLRHGVTDRRWLSRLVAEYARETIARDPEGARAAFEDSLRLDPQSVTGRLYLGDFLLQRGETKAALARWQEIIEIAPDRNAVVRGRLERAYYELGRYEDITSSYEKLLRRVPGDTALAVALALIYRKKENYDEAVGLLMRTCAGRTDPLCTATLVALELDRGRAGEAARLVDRLVEELNQPSSCPSCGGELSCGERTCPACGDSQPAGNA